MGVPARAKGDESSSNSSLFYIRNGKGNCLTRHANGYIVTGKEEPLEDRYWSIEYDEEDTANVAFKNVQHDAYLFSSAGTWGSPLVLKSEKQLWRVEEGKLDGSFYFWNLSTSGYLQNWDSSPYINSYIRIQQNQRQAGRGFEWHLDGMCWYVVPTLSSEIQKMKAKAESNQEALAERQIAAENTDEGDTGQLTPKAEKAELLPDTTNGVVNDDTNHNATDEVCKDCGENHTCEQLRKRAQDLSEKDRTLQSESDDLSNRKFKLDMRERQLKRRSTSSFDQPSSADGDEVSRLSKALRDSKAHAADLREQLEAAKRGWALAEENMKAKETIAELQRQAKEQETICPMCHNDARPPPRKLKRQVVAYVYRPEHNTNAQNGSAHCESR